MNAIDPIEMIPMPSQDQFLEALPPHSIEAEHSLLGGLMLDNHMWDEIADVITTPMFYHPANRMLFDAMRELSAHDQPLDVVTVSEVLEAKNQLDITGGLASLAELARNISSIGQWRTALTSVQSWLTFVTAAQSSKTQT